jgi:hypothetical protein
MLSGSSVFTPTSGGAGFFRSKIEQPHIVNKHNRAVTALIRSVIRNLFIKTLLPLEA